MSIEALLRWAEAYYPSRAVAPPDIAAMRLSDAEIVELFAKVPSRRAQLALVGQAAIRDRLSDQALADAATVAWRRNP
jgi:hypothetical protein